MRGGAVPTMLWSSAARNMPVIRPLITTRICLWGREPLASGGMRGGSPCLRGSQGFGGLGILGMARLVGDGLVQECFDDARDQVPQRVALLGAELLERVRDHASPGREPRLEAGRALFG